MKTLLLATSLLATLGASAAMADTRGPDSAGYVATNNVTYTFNDITATGTKILQDVDDQTQSVLMGMNFTFYGQAYSGVNISSNGILQFGGASNAYTNYDLTQAQGPSQSRAIYTFWDDLITPTQGDASRGVYYQTFGDVVGHRKFVVQEIANQYSIGGNSINFQTVLDEATGDILMRYTQTAFGNAGFDNGASATVGIQGLQALGQTVQWSFNTPSLTSGESLCFTQNANAACNAIVDATPSVPEPASWAMMLFGFGVLGYSMRRTLRASEVKFNDKIRRIAADVAAA